MIGGKKRKYNMDSENMMGLRKKDTTWGGVFTDIVVVD